MLGFFRQHGQDLVNLIRQRLSQHFDVEHVSDLHLVKVGKQAGGRQATMPGKRRMGVFAADRQ